MKQIKNINLKNTKLTPATINGSAFAESKALTIFNEEDEAA